MSHSDDVKALSTRIGEAIRRVTSGAGVMRLPVDPTDPDVVLADCLAHIDGEAARMADAVARAREEQREADAKFCPNCLGVGFVERPVPCPYCDDSTYDHYCPTGTQRQQCGCGAERIRATPLDATPLADELAEAERGEQEAWRQVDAMRERAEEAEARVKEFERLQQVWLMSPAAAKRLAAYRELGEKCAGLEAKVEIANRYLEAGRDRAEFWEKAHAQDTSRLEAELARLTSDVPGLSPGPAYTAVDVDAIERHRGKLYERLRATVAERDEAVRALRGLDDACSSVASWSEECVDYSDPARVAARAVLAKYPEGT